MEASKFRFHLETLLHFALLPQTSVNSLKKNQLLAYKNDCEIKYELYTELVRNEKRKNWASAYNMLSTDTS